MPRYSPDPPQAGPDKRQAQKKDLDHPTGEAEAERERRARLHEAFDDIRKTRPGFRASDNLPREALYDRDLARAEARAAAEKEGWSPAESSSET